MLINVIATASQSGVASTVANSWSHTDWISLVAAVGTILSAIVALWLGVHSVRRERTERRELTKLRRREQASSVVLWVESARRDNGKDMILYNGSSLPIYDIHMIYTTIGSHEEDAGEVVETASLKSVIEAADRTVESLAYEEWDMSAKPMRAEFTDAAGNRWTRFENGDLIEQEPN